MPPTAHPNAPSRRRTLSDEARARLRAAALRNRPWEHATGPTSATGKDRSKQNAWKHGRETADRRRLRRLVAECLRLIGKHRTLALGGPNPEQQQQLHHRLRDLSELIVCSGTTGR